MNELNYLRIAQILGGTVSETQQPTFGVLGAAAVSVERFRLISSMGTEPTPIPAEQSPLIAIAFEKVRNGFETDRVLVDPSLYKQFIAECRRAGIKAPEQQINKRLQAFRKSSNYGIKLTKTTKPAGLDPEPYFYSAELGYVQLSYRKQVSVDDVITEPRIGEEFVSLCKQIDPHGRAMDFKWSLLRLRKMRSFGKSKAEKLLAVGTDEVENNLRLIGSLDRISLGDVPADKGFFSLNNQSDGNSYLYVGATQRTVRAAFEPFRAAHPFMALAGTFWQPLLSEITLSVAVVKKRLLGASPRDLSLRLIKERHPLFNMPVHLQVGEDDDDENEAA